jgi:drug/metabolite transporter (DMT)-like permease
VDSGGAAGVRYRTRVRAPLVAVLFAVASCLCYAGAAVRQEHLARATGTGTLALVRRPTWWWSVLLIGVASGLHVGALRFGPLTVVQPLDSLTLVFAVPLSALVYRRPVAGGELRGVLATVAGLAGLLLLAGSTAPVRPLDRAETLAVGAITAAVVGLLMVSAGVAGGPPRGGPPRGGPPRGGPPRGGPPRGGPPRGGPPRGGSPRGGSPRRGLSYAAASGIASGVASALAQTVTVLFGQTGWGSLLSVAAILVAVFAPAGLLLAQAAYRYGLGAPLAVVVIANPVAAGAIGILRLGERFTAGVPGIALAACCALLLGYGVAVLAAHAPDDRPAVPTT